MGYELNVYPENIEQLPLPISDLAAQSPIIESVETLLKLNHCEATIEATFNDLLNKFGFSRTNTLSHFYPNNPVEVGIDVVNSQNFDEPELLRKFSVDIEGNFLVLTDDGETTIYKICFSNRETLFFFFLSIKRFLAGSNKRQYNDLLDAIEIPIFAPNRLVNAEKITALMSVLGSWHQEAMGKELRDCPVKSLDLAKFESLKGTISREIDRAVYKMFNLTEQEISQIERARNC